MNNIKYALISSLLAGLSTMIGTLPIFFKIKNQNKIISSSCAFASGIILSISIFDLLPEGIKYFKINNSFIVTIIYSLSFLLLGIIISMILDNYVEKKNNKNNLYKVGLLSMIVLMLHNIPEGMVTFIVSSKNLKLGLPISLAIALHNIPEGISISIPIYYSTKSKIKAILYTLISSLSEPFGAIITYLFLKNIINNTLLGILFSIIAGIMLQISTCELLPSSLVYGKKRYSYYYFFIGFILMLIILILF